MAWQPGSNRKMTRLPKATSIAFSVYLLIKGLEMLWFVIMLRFKYLHSNRLTLSVTLGETSWIGVFFLVSEGSVMNYKHHKSQTKEPAILNTVLMFGFQPLMPVTIGIQRNWHSM